MDQQREPSRSPLGTRHFSSSAPRPSAPALADILLVDDDPAIRQVLSLIVRSSGHRPATAEGVAAAETLLEKSTFQLLVTDSSMPGRNGISLIRSVRASGCVVPILVYSATGNPRKMLEAGADRFLAKPARLEQIQQAIRQLLAHGRRRARP